MAVKSKAKSQEETQSEMLDALRHRRRDGIAARGLEGVMAAEVYLDPQAMSCVAAATAIRAAPEAGAEQMDQLLFGERFDVIEEEADEDIKRLAGVGDEAERVGREIADQRAVSRSHRK